MKTKYCLPIIKNSLTKVKNMIGQHSEYGIYEVWLDYLVDLSTPLLQSVAQDNKSFIFCFRRKNGGFIQMPFKQRKDIIDFCKGKNIFIDCDIEQQNKDLSYIKTKNNELDIRNYEKIKTIASYHNYHETLDEEKISKTILEMRKYNPDIYKISTYCQSPEDAVSLMRLLLELKKQHKRAIVVGMGDYGKITRIFGVLYGNEITFAPATLNQQSAEGQLTKEQIKEIIGNIKRSA